MWFIFPIIFLIIFVLIIWILAKTYTFKNKFFLWLAIIIPPLLLIYLIWVPFDMPTIVLWLPGMIVFLVSAISIIANFLKFIFLSKGQKDEKNKFKIRFIRPTLAILIFLFAFLCLAASQKSADNYAVNMSKKIQSECNAEKKCPENIAGWWNDLPELSGYTSAVLYGKYGTKYRVSYSVSEDKQSFNMAVRHNIDEGLSINGGVDKQLDIKLWSAGKE